MSYTLKEKQIDFAEEDLIVSFPHPIQKVLEHEGTLFILLEVPTTEVCNNNIHGLTMNGGIKWIVKESPHGTQEQKPYKNIWIKDGRLIAGCWNGVDYYVDHDTGDIEVADFQRF